MPKITGRQADKLLHIAKHGRCGDSVACSQLEKKGLVVSTGGVYERHEWGRAVSSIPCYQLTSEGERMVNEEKDALKTLRSEFYKKKLG